MRQFNMPDATSPERDSSLINNNSLSKNNNYNNNIISPKLSLIVSKEGNNNINKSANLIRN